MKVCPFNKAAVTALVLLIAASQSFAVEGDPQAKCLPQVLSALLEGKPLENPTSAVGVSAASHPEYPKFDFTRVSPPSRTAYESYQRTETWDSANPIVRENAEYYFKLLRSDPNLAKLSDKELQDSALKVLSWRLKISSDPMSVANMYDPPEPSPGAAFNLEKYRLYLKAAGIDPDTRPPSFQAMLAGFGYQSLAHGTSIEGFFDILKHGKLVSREVGKQEDRFSIPSNGKYVYLEALPKSQEAFYFKRSPDQKGKWNEMMPIYLEIDSSALDQLRWSHLNVYWQYGKHDPGFSIQPSNLVAGFFNQLKEVPVSKDNQPPYGFGGAITTSRISARNEFLFTDSVPLSYIKGIYVNPVFKDQVISQLKSLGVDQAILDKIH